MVSNLLHYQHGNRVEVTFEGMGGVARRTRRVVGVASGQAVVLHFVVWVFFHLLGNSTFGYMETPSLFGWMNYAYNSQEDDRHGKLIPLVVLALLLVKRRELTAVLKAPWWPALVVVVAGLLLHVAGYISQQAISILAFFLLGLPGVYSGWRWAGLLRALFSHISSSSSAFRWGRWRTRSLFRSGHW